MHGIIGPIIAIRIVAPTPQRNTLLHPPRESKSRAARSSYLVAGLEKNMINVGVRGSL